MARAARDVFLEPMRWLAAMLLVARVAHADPACEARWRELRAEAMRLADLDERGRRLAALPSCPRDVVEPAAEPEPTFAPHAIGFVSTGLAAERVAYPLATARGLGVFVEAAAGWRFARRWAASGFAGYAGFEDRGYLGSYDVVHHFYELGGRLGMMVDGIELGAKLGVELDDAAAFFDVPAHRDALPLAGIDARIGVVPIGPLQITFAASVEAAWNPRSSSDLSLYGDVYAVRLAVGCQL